MTNNEKFYTAENVAAVYENIRNRKEHKLVCSYRILIDGRTIVKRTYNLNEFYSFRHALKPETKTISITIYGRFAPVASYELKRVDPVVKVKSGYSPNEELAYENIRLFSEGLDKDVQIFELRERLARAEAKNETNKFNCVEGAELMDMDNAVVIIAPKKNYSKALNDLEAQLDFYREIIKGAREAITKKS